MRRMATVMLAAMLVAAPTLAHPHPRKLQGAAPGAANQPAQAMQEDLRRMRLLLQQMQTNLVYLPSGYSAEKHQFELEIDMWRTLLDHMERNLPATPPAK